MRPRATGITESSLYVEDVPHSVKFYGELLDAPVILEDERFCALRVAPGQVLLLFHRGASRHDVDMGFGTIIGRHLANPRARRVFNWSMAGLLALSLIPVFW